MKIFDHTSGSLARMNSSRAFWRSLSGDPIGMGTTVDLDARDGTPILDLKPYIPEAVTPEWLIRSRPPAD
jgi:hypothetical protein